MGFEKADTRWLQSPVTAREAARAENFIRKHAVDPWDVLHAVGLYASPGLDRHRSGRTLVPVQRSIDVLGGTP